MKYSFLLFLALSLIGATPGFCQKKALLNTSKEISKILRSHSKTSADKVCLMIKAKVKNTHDHPSNNELDAAVVKAINLLRATEAPKEVEGGLNDLYGYTIALIMLYDDAPAKDRFNGRCDIAKNNLNSKLRSIQNLIKNLLDCWVINYQRDFELAILFSWVEWDDRYMNCLVLRKDLKEQLEDLDYLSNRVARYCQ